MSVLKILNDVLAKFIVHTIAVTTRRLHDINKSGWCQLIELTIIGILLIIIWCVTEGENKKINTALPSKLNLNEDKHPLTRHSVI
jgi:uncharacterized membrane protein YhaH (DUF805 family)